MDTVARRGVAWFAAVSGDRKSHPDGASGKQGTRHLPWLTPIKELAMPKVMELLNSYTGEMRCRVCGSVHFASIKPHSNGLYYRGSWTCSYRDCPSNSKEAVEAKANHVER